MQSVHENLKDFQGDSRMQPRLRCSSRLCPLWFCSSGPFLLWFLQGPLTVAAGAGSSSPSFLSLIPQDLRCLSMTLRPTISSHSIAFSKQGPPFPHHSCSKSGKMCWCLGKLQRLAPKCSVQSSYIKLTRKPLRKAAP